MGKKSGAAEKHQKQAAAVAFVLKVPTHCRCDGCDDKIRGGVRDLARRCDGVVSLDTSALATKGELAVVATADPEKLRRRLSKRTGKTVDLVFIPKPPPAKPADGKESAAVQALLAALHQHQQQQQQQAAAQAHHHHHLHGQPVPGYAWNALQQQQQHGGGGYGYPWVLHQQAPAPAPEPYFGSYPAAASWGAYPHAGDPHHNGLGGGGWFGY